MVSPAPQPDTDSGPPPADPRAIRECLPPDLAAEFDREWVLVVDRVKQSMDLADLQTLLHKWQHTVVMERRDPGSYARMLADAEEILRTGVNPNAGSFEEMQAVIRRRLSQ
ncbi:DUF6247 family protein [Sporichthya sp.]|uniref:DUF6247 family protein n=1 Tax=Sporichthya sp. TaxID=65475 RepID=UPI0018347E7A|nr:DUF6247 family protein [Sporichthya sp.]MBA3744619.1 hypothetical protein [Sporichthya sp.]